MITSNYSFLPKYFTKKGIISFAIILFFCFIFFIQKALPLQWILFGFVEVIGFFFFANLFTKRWTNFSIQQYQRKLLWLSFGIRMVWVVFSYLYFSWMTGQPFEFETADAKAYHSEAIWLSGLLTNGKLDIYLKYIGLNYSDMGYPFYLGLLQYVFGDSILLPRLIKAFLGAYTCILIYKIARNNFGESAGRIAGILSMLLPNLIYYCGLHVKETEMVFLTTIFIYYVDMLLRKKSFNFKYAIIILIVGALLFLFRTVLAACLIGSVVVSVFFVSERVSNSGKRIGIFLLILLASIGIFFTALGDTLFGYIQESDQNLSSQMDNFSTTTNANKLAKYGTRGVFLPFMLMAPFPTLVDSNQPNPMMLGGAYFTRNVYVFFVFIAFVTLFKRRQLRNHTLLFAILFSYLFVLASSGFALSERFHLPIVPMLLIFAAYGITQINIKNKKYYIPYLVLVSIIVIGWNWFKLVGRV